jgi:hypothetical protein
MGTQPPKTGLHKSLDEVQALCDQNSAVLGSLYSILLMAEETESDQGTINNIRQRINTHTINMKDQIKVLCMLKAPPIKSKMH